jgi:C1A family cysteine protease
MSVKHRAYGWAPDLPDHRDFVYAAPHAAAALPPKADLRAQCPPVYDQGELGSCTGNALAAAIDFDRRKQNLPLLGPSRLFIYYNERALENTVASDNGAMLRDGMKSIASQGVCAESLWPYDPASFAVKRSDACYTAAQAHRALVYSRIPSDLRHLKSCLAQGFPFVCGFTAYESLESDEVARTGEVPLPELSEASIGGHAVLVVGYDDATKRFLIRNSWGADWGRQGYCTMPYAYLTNPNLADDFWTLRTVTQA